jgi:hypothetical protein
MGVRYSINGGNLLFSGVIRAIGRPDSRCAGSHDVDNRLHLGIVVRRMRELQVGFLALAERSCASPMSI